MNPRITVAICTWNRAALLAQTLATFTRLTVPPDLVWELLVVNNAGTDETDQLLQSFAGRLPLKSLYEPELGLSHARNRAVAAASGDYIVWTDDDVLVSQGWLSEYHDAFRRFPDAVLFGGAVLPRYASAPPPWLQEVWPQVAGYYAIRKRPAGAEPIARDYLPNGANFALRMDVQRRHLYQPALGRKGSLLVGGEEWQVLNAVLQEGGTGWWLPEAAVEHWLPAERLTTSYLRRAMQAQGEAVPSHAMTANRLSLLGRPVRLWQKVVFSELRYRLHRVISKPEVWFAHFQRASFLQGQFRGYR